MNDDAGLELVLFYAGGHRFAVEASQVRASRPDREDSEATDALALLGLAGVPDDSHRLLLIKTAGADRLLRVADPVDLVTLAVADIHPPPSLLLSRSHLRGLRAVALRAGLAIPILDLAGLLVSD